MFILCSDPSYQSQEAIHKLSSMAHDSVDVIEIIS